MAIRLDGDCGRFLRSQHVKLIAVSGHGSELDKQLALASGFNHHLTKPVDFDELLALIAA
ncbi:MAG TPA: hypothetical protein VFP68_02085 [Burkholderiaceae bacterium]|nr:hypothetical protein [Burkholderiaceae bacterium]